jgi:hypothetical protein
VAAIFRSTRNLAAQRMSIVKVAGVAGDHLASRLREWAGLRTAETPSEWSPDQWPQSVRTQIDSIASLVRENATEPPVIHFVEWIDLWSMGDLFRSWLSPSGGETPLTVFGDRFEVYGHCLPDDGLLLRRLANDRKHQFPEAEWFLKRLDEAINAWQDVAGRSLIVVLREVTGGLVTDDELAKALDELPNWMPRGR